MVQNKIIQIQELTVLELTNLIRTSLKEELNHLQIPQNDNVNSDELLTRKDVLKLLGISSVTLWNYQNSGQIKVYKFSNKCFYKKSELFASLIKLDR